MHTSNGFDSEGETMVKTRLVHTYERVHFCAFLFGWLSFMTFEKMEYIFLGVVVIK